MRCSTELFSFLGVRGGALGCVRSEMLGTLQIFWHALFVVPRVDDLTLVASPAGAIIVSGASARMDTLVAWVHCLVRVHAYSNSSSGAIQLSLARNACSSPKRQLVRYLLGKCAARDVAETMHAAAHGKGHRPGNCGTFSPSSSPCETWL